jgi:ribonuclease HI
MELMAVVEALMTLKRPCAVEIVTDAAHIYQGGTTWLAEWAANGWRRSGNRAITNLDLWQQLYAQMQLHAVRFTKVDKTGSDPLSQRVQALVQETIRDEYYCLLIAGSRRANANMLEYVRRAVAIAQERGWLIVVGDHPAGVDAEVSRACNQHGMTAIVCGIDDAPRYGGVQQGIYVKVEAESYTQRDQYMVDLCRRALFVWNGSSRGTAAGYQYARQQGKTAHLLDFGHAFTER